MLITIFDSSGSPKAQLSPDDSSTQVKEVQGDSVLTLSFTHYDHIALDVDDYVDFEGERFWLTERYRPRQNARMEWVYDIKLYGVESMLRRLLVIKTADGEDDPVFTLTAPPREHMAMIVGCMNLGMGNISDWKVGNVTGTDNIVIDYFGKYCDEALREIAEKVGAEWWVEGQTVNVCRCEHGEPVAMGYGKGLLSIDPATADNVKFYTRLYPVGSSRNIDREKYGFSRLQLPGGQKFVEINADRYGRVDHYEKDAFSGIYPRRTGTVSGVRSEEKTGEDGNPFTIYYFKDKDLPFDPNDYEIGALVKRVSFQEGSELAGLGQEENGTYYFEVNYDSASKEFEIITIWPYDDGMQLPGAPLVPKAGDRYILWNISMPDVYYSLAEQEFLDAVQQYNAAHNLDISVYKAPTDHVWIEDNGVALSIGSRIRLESAEYFPGEGFRDSRITKITRKVNLPSSMDIEIGDALSRSSLQKMSDSIEDVRSYARSVGESVSLPDIIRTGDRTLPTDNNLFSARRSRREFLNKNAPDRAKSTITFEQGAHFGDFVKGQFYGRGGGVDGAGNAEFESIVSRSYLKVMELIYNRLNAQEGDTSFSDFGTIEEILTDGDGNTVARMRKRWEGDFTAFQPGDIVYGYVNNLDKADVKEWYKSWAWIKSVDRDANQLTIAQYPGSEVPSGINHPMTAGMNITRWGNIIEPSADTYSNPDFSLVIGKRGDGSYYNMRQSTFFISTADGNLVELMGVNRPIIEKFNYGTVLGKIPEGLLDPKTEELINKGQPYLYARGIIVQDLIRIGYEGVPARSANYCGCWDAATAASDTRYYRNTVSMYDIVTHEGNLWQCVVAHASAQPPSEQNPSWVRMTSDGSLRIWAINPSVNVVSVRADEIVPAALECTVTLTASGKSPVVINSSADLYDQGAALWYSLDGEIWYEYVMGDSGPLELEDGSGYIETEDSAGDDGFLALGGDSIDTADIADRIYFELRAVKDDALLASTQVPVVKDGARGSFPSIVFIRTNEAPATPTGGTYDSPIPTSSPQWHDGIPEGEEMLWASTRIFRDNVETEWDPPRPMTDTATFDVEFSDVDEDPGNPADNPGNWHDPDSDGFDSKAMLWRAERHKKNGVWSGWEIFRIKGEKGDPGVSASWTSQVFKESDAKPDTPTDTENTIPDGWVDAPSGEGRWWMSIATIDGATGKPGPWSDPVPVTGLDGVPGSTPDFKFRVYDEGLTPLKVENIRHPEGWEDAPPKIGEGQALWMIYAEIDHDDNLVGQWSKPRRLSGEKGDDGGVIYLWSINPNANIVSVRRNEVIPAKLTATVSLSSSRGEPIVFDNGVDLFDAGASLFFSLDGLEWRQFVMGTSEPLELEDGTGLIELEDSEDDSNVLTIGGDDIDTSAIGDRICFELRSVADGALLASTQVPVVKDGQDGKDGAPGREGLMVYPAGIYDPSVLYTATEDTVPMVMYDGQRYRLRAGASYRGDDDSEVYKNPAEVAANEPADTSRWIRFTDFSPVYTDILMADFAKLSDAVFYGHWMISQRGRWNGAPSSEYQHFKDASDPFVPNLSINFLTGEIRAAYGVFEGNLVTRFKNIHDSDAIYDPATDSFTLADDLKVIAGIEPVYLPADLSYAGARATVCNSVKGYSRTDQMSKLRVAGGGCIYGLKDPGGVKPVSGAYTISELQFLTGIVELVAVPDTDKCDWFIVSNNTYYSHQYSQDS